MLPNQLNLPYNTPDLTPAQLNLTYLTYLTPNLPIFYQSPQPNLTYNISDLPLPPTQPNLTYHRPERHHLPSINLPSSTTPAPTYHPLMLT